MPESINQIALWAQRLQAMSQTGLTYAGDRYDRARYEELRAIASDMMAAALGTGTDELANRYSMEEGYATPKIDVRAVAFRDDAILLVRERSDGLWTLPGGWADVGDSPSHAAERETWEESGYIVKAVRLLALYDMHQHDHPPIPFHAYKVFFLCEITGGEASLSDETDAVEFFRRGSLPHLSTERVTKDQIVRLFDLANSPQRQADFD